MDSLQFIWPLKKVFSAHYFLVYNEEAFIISNFFIRSIRKPDFYTINVTNCLGNDKTIEMLLNYGASIDPITNDGRTPLFIAVYKDHSIKHIYPYSAISRGNSEKIHLK